jgi:polysaccharide export outer membrane protein
MPTKLPAALVIASLAITACFPTEIDPAYQQLVEQQDRIPPVGELGPNDKFELRVFHEPELSGSFTASAEGTINYPYIGRLTISGKTCADLEEEIAAGLRQGYIANPNVSCTILEYNSKRIFIFGQVKSPGAYPYRSSITVIEAIALAGGFSERADQNRTNLSRSVNGSDLQVRVPVQEIVENRQKNIRLLPGDIISVPVSPW